jgi:hypothetical protein
VGNGGSLEIHLEHLLAGILGRLFDGLRNFVGFAVSDADASAAITDDDQSAEAEGAAAFDDFGAAVDSDDGGFDSPFFAATIAVASSPTAAASTALATATTALPTASATLTTTATALTTASTALAAATLRAALRRGLAATGRRIGSCALRRGCGSRGLMIRWFLLFFSHEMPLKFAFEIRSGLSNLLTT